MESRSGQEGKWPISVVRSISYLIRAWLLCWQSCPTSLPSIILTIPLPLTNISDRCRHFHRHQLLPPHEGRWSRGSGVQPLFLTCGCLSAPGNSTQHCHFLSKRAKVAKGTMEQKKAHLNASPLACLS